MAMVILATDVVDLDRWTHTTRTVRTYPHQLEWCRDRFTISTQPEHDHAENPFMWITDGLFHIILIFAKSMIVITCTKDKIVQPLLLGNEGGDGTDENNTTEERIDEIKQYLDARYISPPEACWTIFKYDMQNKSHHIHRLPVHDEDQQHVHFPTNTRIQDVNAINQFTKLTTFLELCRLNGPGSDIARRLLYHEVPIHFVWVKMGDKYVWQPRQCGGDKSIGRLISVSPRDINRPKSFEEFLKTVDGVIMETYKTAALSFEFLESDEESHRCLLEV
ncbi:Helitron helicase [Phytophthora megakarya]|uniref:Helitron helicase n=1 Tax=Phytophthora megakarya TaxID=4795 RepID=A0A225VMW3_9STRA|nr:Helitron helicase [Phytophthora megakarya]